MKNVTKAYRFTYIFLGIMITILLAFLILWCSKSYTVTFDTDGAQSYEAISVRPAQKIELPPTPVKEGYTFEGWYYDDKKFDENTLIFDNITLKAKWKSIMN